jgi:sec-independent protein translocase protein TatB
MARQTELDELRKEIEELKKNNPVNDLANSMASVESEVNSSMQAVAPAAEAEPAAAVPVESVEPRSGEFAVTDSAPQPRNAPIVETS